MTPVELPEPSKLLHQSATDGQILFSSEKKFNSHKFPINYQFEG